MGGVAKGKAVRARRDEAVKRCDECVRGAWKEGENLLCETRSSHAYNSGTPEQKSQRTPGPFDKEPAVVSADRVEIGLDQVHDELSEQVFRLLVGEKEAFGFLPARNTPAGSADGDAEEAEDPEDVGLPQPEEDDDTANGPAKRHVDLRLQTALSPERLQRRLLELYRDARTMIEEQGVNVLFLAVCGTSGRTRSPAPSAELATPRSSQLIHPPTRDGLEAQML